MIPYIFVTPEGEIVGNGISQIECVDLIVPGLGIELVLDVYAAPDGSNYWNAASKKLCSIPTKPSELHTFDYKIKKWVVDEVTAWRLIRQKRDELLLESDWTQLPDVPIETKNKWSLYRHALRDITLQKDPQNIVWPDKP